MVMSICDISLHDHDMSLTHNVLNDNLF